MECCVLSTDQGWRGVVFVDVARREIRGAS